MNWGLAWVEPRHTVDFLNLCGSPLKTALFSSNLSALISHTDLSVDSKPLLGGAAFHWKILDAGFLSHWFSSHWSVLKSLVFDFLRESADTAVTTLRSMALEGARTGFYLRGYRILHCICVTYVFIVALSSPYARQWLSFSGFREEVARPGCTLLSLSRINWTIAR